MRRKVALASACALIGVLALVTACVGSSSKPKPKARVGLPVIIHVSQHVLSGSAPYGAEVAHAIIGKKCGQLRKRDAWKKMKLRVVFARCTVTAAFKITKPHPPTPTTTKPVVVPTIPSPPTPRPPIATPTTQPTAVPQPTMTAVASSPQIYLLNLINNERAVIGSAPLGLNQTLSGCALAHAKAMAATGQIWHTNSAYPSISFPNDICVPFSSAAGQNVGQDNEPVLNGIQSDFNLMMSEGNQPLGSCLSGHDCNITYRGYRAVGIGVWDDGSRVWIVESFVG